MAGLVSKKIKDSYKSLIRVDDDSNGLDGSLANITDGAGNTGPFQMSRTAVEFTSGTSLTLGASTALNTRQVNAASGTLGLSIDFSPSDTGLSKIILGNNLADALNIAESTNSYLKFVTTTGSEKIVLGKDVEIAGDLTAATITGDVNFDSNTLFIDESTDQVGIGISSSLASGAKLHVKGNDGANYIHIESANDNNYLTLGTFENDQVIIAYGDTDTGGSSALNFYRTTSAPFGGSSLVMSLNSRGNLGLGVTPDETNTNYDCLQVGGNASILSFGTQGAGGEVDFNHNVHYNQAGNYVYQSTDEATRYRQGGGKHSWFTASSGTAGNTISFTKRMQIFEDGDVLIGNGSNVSGFTPSVTIMGSQPGLGLRGQDSNSGYFYNTILNTSGSGSVKKFYSSTVSWATAANDGGTSESTKMSLDTSGNVTLSGSLTSAGLVSSSTINSSMSGTGSLSNTAFRTIDGNSNEGIRIEHGGGDGRILIYSANSHRGTITANEHTAGVNGLTVGTTANEDLNFVTNGTSNIRARVFKDGNVGIGNHSSGNAITTSANQLKVYDDSAGAYATHIEQNQGDGLCLDLFASASDDHNDDALLRARTDANTLLELFNDGDLNLGPGGFYTNTVDNTKGFIFTDGSTTSSFPNVQNSGGKGMVQGRLEITASGGAQNVAKSHWGGISLIGFSASGLQGIDIVGWGYAPTTPVVLATGNWVGSLSRSYSTVNYHLQMNVGSTVNVFTILIGI